MKFTIEQHREHLKNSITYATEMLGEIERRQDDYERIKQGNLALAKQITEAVRIGKDSFDSEKFMVKRRAK